MRLFLSEEFYVPWMFYAVGAILAMTWAAVMVGVYHYLRDHGRVPLRDKGR